MFSNIPQIPPIPLSLMLATFCLSTVLLQAPGAAGEPPVKDAKAEEASPQQEYQALLERVKKSDASVDFKRMRWLQTQLDSYDPYGASREHPMAAFRAGEVAQAKMLAEGILAENYLHLESHLAAAAVADQRGDAAAAAHHKYVAQGVLDSILQSGDGKTLDTAFQVIALSEEYAVMRHFGLRITEQALVHGGGGHSYDLLKGEDPESGSIRDVYFNIDPIMSALAKKFSP
ncbi:MAG TPA: DUF4919 domain-containing protein [Thermoanaerobaculia bacterium]